MGSGLNPKSLPSSDTHDLAVCLAPVLRQMCDGKLGEIEWFRSTWQRGGAATGFSNWTFGDGRTTGVIVKLPVGPREYAWTVGLGAVEHDAWESKEASRVPVPRVVAAGEMLGGYDLGWIVIERLDGPTLNHEISAAMISELVDAAATFQASAARVRPVTGPGETRDWGALISKSREALEFAHMPDVQRWRSGLKKLEKCLGRVLAEWDARPLDSWCHGDVHPGNAMRRRTENGHPGRCVLLDLAFVHPGHWVEDAVYIERQFWAHPELLGDLKPVREMGRRRRDLGLAASGDQRVLAGARRVLMAGCAPAWWETEGTPAYARGALEMLERDLSIFGK